MKRLTFSFALSLSVLGANTQTFQTDLLGTESWQTPAGMAEKFQALGKSAFTLLRGTPRVFFRQALQGEFSSPVMAALGNHPTLIVGDFHIQNTGIRVPDEIVFALNDFDEAALGNPGYDLLRYLMSIRLFCEEEEASRDLNAMEAMQDFLKAYQEELEKISQSASRSREMLTAQKARREVEKLIKKAGKKSIGDQLAKYTDGHGQLLRSEKIRDVPQETARILIQALEAHLSDQRLKVLDIGERLGAGLGSRGRLRYYFLTEGDSTGSGDEWIIELKEQAYPAMALELDPESIVTELSAAENAAYAALSMHDAEEFPLSAIHVQGKDWLVRRRIPQKDGFEAKDLKKQKDLAQIVEDSALVLARAHAASRENPASWASSVEGLLNQESRASLAELAHKKAEQMIENHTALQNWLSNSGSR